MEASNHAPQKRAHLISNCFDLSNLSAANVSFKYHMYGSAIGNLKLDISTDGTNWTTIWSKSGNQGNSWKTASVNLNNYLNQPFVTFRLNGTTGSSWRGDIAVDAFNIQATPTAANSKSLTDVTTADYLTIIPNPFQDFVTIQTNKKGLKNYRLVNIQGQTVKEGQIQGERLALDGLISGLYFLTIYNEEEQIIRKLVKQ